MTAISPRSGALVVRALAVAVAAVLLGTLLTIAEPRPTPASAGVTMTLTTLEQTHLHRLNDWRAARGLGRLQIDAVTQLDARDWTRSMAGSNRLSHDPGAGSACRSASTNCARWAENVGYSSSGEATVFSAFEGSPGHRANLANPHVDRVGVGVFVDGAGRTWVTQRFIQCGCTNDGTARAANDQRHRFEDFVRALHVDFLDRPATAAEVVAAVDGLVYGVDAVGTLAGSDPWLGALIDRYYRSTLGRSSDDAGKRHWIDTYRSGSTPADIAAFFYASDEFFRRVGGSNRAWVGALYREILGRAADSGGLDHWAGEADRGVSRADIAHGFYQSVESRQTRVDDLYLHLLGRHPDSVGRTYWADILLDGRDVRLAANLAGSAEYQQRATRRF